MTTIVPPALAPFQPPLGPQPASPILYSANQVVLRMKEKVWSLSGDDFTVQTVEGAHIMKVKGKLVSIHNKKKFVDMQNNEIFTLSEKKLKLNKTFHGEAPGAHNFEIKGHFSLGSSKSTVEFVNNSDRTTVELQVKGDWFDRTANISLGDRVVAQISRSFFNAREVLDDKQTYFVTVAPNVDLSLIAAICVCLDEREND
ncbi:Protein LURP-one-related 10 [Pseudocercospora fuligena]|uniref:Protein LURP-one-related 10 n=1 Tax=Pseudocercospora fuligena TaxID=685502 RepID=A0A8H6VKR6_9PEZI|nr:Protein LURP-one-related 10 [Pseudocercospora fuligena]